MQTSPNIKVIFFGPGFGESILLCFGDNLWVVVDSCIANGQPEPAPISYLKKNGLDPAANIKLIIASHWHDDHIRGISKIVSECPSAEIVFSSALKADEFLSLILAYDKRKHTSTSGLSELSGIINLLDERQKTPIWAIANRLLWRTDLLSGKPLEIVSLSPSDSAISSCFAHFKSLLPNESNNWGVIPKPNRNDSAIALHISAGNISLLLGSDLENSTEATSGWSAITTSPTRPSQKSCIFKIPHHGSSNAHDQNVWDLMLHDNPFCVLSPFCKGSVRLPQKTDVERILSYTSNAFSTCKYTNRKLHRERVVDKKISELGYNVKLQNPGFGSVTFDAISDSINVTLDGDAVALHNVVTE